MIQVINRAFDILEYIARSGGEVKSLGEIAGDLSLNAGTCANILKTMVSRNYIQKVDKQKGYILGTMAEGFTGYEAQTKKLMEAARRDAKLTKQVNENSVLGILREDKRIVLLRSHGNHDLQANTATEKKPYTSSTGRLMVALLDDEKLDAFLKKYGLPTAEEWPEGAELKSFRKQVTQIRKSGYAVQITKGQIIGFAVPVYNGNAVTASLSVYMPTTRYSKEPEPLIRLLNATAKRIEKELK